MIKQSGDRSLLIVGAGLSSKPAGLRTNKEFFSGGKHKEPIEWNNHLFLAPMSLLPPNIFYVPTFFNLQRLFEEQNNLNVKKELVGTYAH